MQDALNAQINAELWSGYLYLSMSMDAQDKGLRGLAHWMFVQWKEEQEHARLLQQYMHAQRARVQLKAIATVPTEWEDAQAMVRQLILHEEEVSAMINDLMDLASDEHDFATMGRLRWFVDEQVEEEEAGHDLLCALEMVGDDSYGCYELDQQLLHRKFKELAEG